MRIITGEAKGHRLKSIKKSSTRPTTEMVRAAIFSMLEPLVDNWSSVLDLYAGSGALGIEALSRGAEWVDFVEQKEKCCATIWENLKRTGFESQARVHCSKAHKALSWLKREYNVVLLDPPYSIPSLEDILEKLCQSGVVGARSTIVVQHSRHQLLPPSIEGFTLVKERRYGDTCVSIYQRGGALCS